MRVATLGIVSLFAVCPMALAQGDNGLEGRKMAEELQRIGERLEELQRIGERLEELQRIGERLEDISESNENLYWSSIGISAISIVAVGGITVYLINRQLKHMDKDAKIKRRPILSWSKFEDGRMYNVKKLVDSAALTIRLVNVGHIAALSITGSTKPTKTNRPDMQYMEPGLIGSLAPNAHTEIPVMLFDKNHKFEKDGIHQHVDVEIKYMDIEGNNLKLSLSITYNDGSVDIKESHNDGLIDGTAGEQSP